MQHIMAQNNTRTTKQYPGKTSLLEEKTQQQDSALIILISKDVQVQIPHLGHTQTDLSESWIRIRT